MNDEIRISDKDDYRFIIKFATVWILFFLYFFVFTSYTYIPLTFIACGVCYFSYHLFKVRELFFDGVSIYVKTGTSHERIDLTNIESASTSMVFSGYYRVDFKHSTKFGKYLLYAPRKESFFTKYQLLKEFISRANQKNT